MALKMTLIEGKGEFSYGRYQENLHIMLSLWEEIAELADFNKVRSTKCQIASTNISFAFFYSGWYCNHRGIQRSSTKKLRRTKVSRFPTSDENVYRQSF